MNSADGSGDEAALRRLAGPSAREVPGWGTVELERGVRDAGPALGLGAPEVVGDVATDELLGARASILRFRGDRLAVVIEPAREHRLAGALARFGEGVVARWVLVAPARLEAVFEAARSGGLRLTDEGAGPFGAERLLAGGSRWGPFLLVAAVPDGMAPGSPAATIEP